MELHIKEVNYGYIVSIPKISANPYVYKKTEEFKMLEFIAKHLIETDVKITQK